MKTSFSIVYNTQKKDRQVWP